MVEVEIITKQGVVVVVTLESFETDNGIARWENIGEELKSLEFIDLDQVAVITTREA